MCGDENLFKELTKVDVGHISFGDASKVAVKGRGTIWYLQKNNRVGEIRDVYYVPDLKSNILSMGQLMEKGYSVRKQLLTPSAVNGMPRVSLCFF